MNRRGFLARASAALGALVASCGLLPELAAAKEPRSDYNDWNETVAVPSETLHAISDQHARRWSVIESIGTEDEMRRYQETLVAHYEKFPPPPMVYTRNRR